MKSRDEYMGECIMKVKIQLQDGEWKDAVFDWRFRKDLSEELTLELREHISAPPQST